MLQQPRWSPSTSTTRLRKLKAPHGKPQSSCNSPSLAATATCAPCSLWSGNMSPFACGLLAVLQGGLAQG